MLTRFHFATQATSRQILICVLVVLFLSVAASASRLRANGEIGAVPPAVVIPVRAQEPGGYPGNPSSLQTPLRQDVTAIVLQRRPDGLYDVSFSSPPNAPTLALSAIDLRPMVPRIPEIARGERTLEEVALAQREFNRNETHFGPGAGADDVRLANNCLRAGLWEVMTARKTDGGMKLDFHGWFEFPMGEYRRLFEEVNGVGWSGFETQMARYPSMGGFKLALETLRRVERSTAVSGLSALSGQQPVRFGEQTRKAKLLITQGIATYGDFTAAKMQPVALARFSEPGYYNLSDPVRFDISWLTQPSRAEWRKVRASHGAQEMTEVEIRFHNGYRLVVGDASLASLPARSEPPKADADVLALTFGIGTPEIYLPAANRMKEFEKPRGNYLFLLDADGRTVDNHQAGVDRVFLWREAGKPDRLHVMLVGYERIAIVGEAVLEWPN